MEDGSYYIHFPFFKNNYSTQQTQKHQTPKYVPFYLTPTHHPRTSSHHATLRSTTISTIATTLNVVKFMFIRLFSLKWTLFYYFLRLFIFSLLSLTLFSSLSLLFSSTDKQKQYAKNIQNQQRHLHAAKVHKATQTKRSCQTKASTLCILSLCCKSTSRSQKEQSRLQNDGNQ